MRRVPAFVWILAPMALAILYAFVHPWLAPRPTLETVVPAEAILTHRYRNQAALDAGWFGAVDPQVRPSKEIGARRNVPELPGVDPQRPFHLVFLPRAQRSDPSMMIFPVADARALRARFEDPSFFLDHGVQRHAQFLEIRGGFAAVGGDRDTVRRIGTGGVTAESLGEDHVLAIRVPALIRYMLVSALQQPWRSMLRAWGFDARQVETTADGVVDVEGRVARVHDAWRTARVWSWLEEGRIRADLEPAPGPLADALAALAASAAGAANGGVPDAPPTALLYVRAPSAFARAAVAWLLWSAGVALPEGMVEGTDEEEAAPGPWGRVDESAPGGLLVWAAPSVGRPRLWTWALAAPLGALPPLTALHPAIPDHPGDAEAAEGELPWTRSTPGAEDPSPPSPLLRRRVGGGAKRSTS